MTPSFFTVSFIFFEALFRYTKSIFLRVLIFSNFSLNFRISLSSKSSFVSRAKSTSEKYIAFPVAKEPKR